jgi:hypothetical protein
VLQSYENLEGKKKKEKKISGNELSLFKTSLEGQPSPSGRDRWGRDRWGRDRWERDRC